MTDEQIGPFSGGQQGGASITRCGLARDSSWKQQINRLDKAKVIFDLDHSGGWTQHRALVLTTPDPPWPIRLPRARLELLSVTLAAGSRRHLRVATILIQSSRRHLVCNILLHLDLVPRRPCHSPLVPDFKSSISLASMPRTLLDVAVGCLVCNMQTFVLCILLKGGAILISHLPVTNSV